MSSNSPYSDWLKFDLHIHTDASSKTKTNDYQGNFSVKTIKEKLIESDVSIFSFTDHNIINVEAYREYYLDYDPSIDPLLLLGVELDILANNNTYHSLLIFDQSTIEKVEDISKRLEEKYSQKSISDLKQRTLTIDDIVDTFPHDNFFFIPHAGSTKSIVKAHVGDIQTAQRMVLLMPSVGIEKVASDEVKRKYNEGFDLLLKESFKNKKDIAYVEFSDNHNAEKYPCKSKDGEAHEFYYVKGSKNYESIRLAFIDPESRLKKHADKSLLENQTNYIRSIKINNSEKIQDSELFFSPHLNVLIGGRSSGKSLLLHLLGQKINWQLDPKVKEKYQKFTINSEISTRIDSQYKSTSEFNKQEIIYLGQGDIVKYFEERKLKDLAKESEKLAEYNGLKSSFDEHKETLESLIGDVVKAYGDLQDETQTTQYSIPEKILSQCISEEFIIKLSTNRDFRSKEQKIEQAQKLLTDIQGKLLELKSNKLIDLSNTEDGLVDQFNLLLNNKLKLINSKKVNNSRQERFITKVSNAIDSRNQLLNTEAKEKVQAKNYIDNLVGNTRSRFKNLKKLNSATKSLEDFKYEKVERIIISDSISLVLETVKAEPIKKIIIEEAIKDGDQESSIYRNCLLLLNNSSTIKNYPSNSSDNLNKKIASVLKTVIENISSPEDYLLYSDGSDSRNNSPGYNSEKYLEIILNNDSNKIIFIDQPEDNLGNKFISDELVKIIRREKFTKQIFLVTHNPSIVVYGDAENIIISENEKEIISYRQVVLEDKDTQAEICQILDGGEYIFSKRSEKYNIKKILENIKNENETNSIDD